MDFIRAGVSTVHQAPPFKYFYGSVLAQKRRSKAFESAVIYVADECSLAGHVDAVCFGAPTIRVDPKKSGILHRDDGKRVFAVQLVGEKSNV